MAQEPNDSISTDDSYVELDSTSTEEESSDKPLDQVQGLDDSTAVNERDFSEAELQSLKEEIKYDFREPPTFGETLWDQIADWIDDFFASLWDKSVGTNWGKLLTYLMTITLVAVGIFVMLRLNAYKIFYSGRNVPLKYSEVDENIHQIDFEREIQAAIRDHNYRRGVRLLYLYALKQLSDGQYIVWEQGKTNHEYLNELQSHELKDGLSKLGYYFDYAWYGNFDVSRDLFEKVNGIFNQWRVKVK
jgi:hypothetical protein